MVELLPRAWHRARGLRQGRRRRQRGRARAARGAPPPVRGERRRRRADRPGAAPRDRAACRRRRGAARDARPASPTSPASARRWRPTSSPQAARSASATAVVGAASRAGGIVVETTGGEIETARRRQLRRAARGPRRAPARRCRRGGRAHDRAVPRRVLRARAVAQPPRPGADLPGARSAVPVPRRPPHAWRARPDPRRPERRARARTRGVLVACDRRATTSPRRCASAGFRELARAQWRYGVSEMARSFSRARFAAALARLVPEVRREDLEPASSGVRAQAVDTDGRLRRRLRVLAQQRRAGAPRAQRAVTGRDGVARDRRRDRPADPHPHLMTPRSADLRHVVVVSNVDVPRGALIGNRPAFAIVERS